MTTSRWIFFDLQFSVEFERAIVERLREKEEAKNLQFSVEFENWC